MSLEQNVSDLTLAILKLATAVELQTTLLQSTDKAAPTEPVEDKVAETKKSTATKPAQSAEKKQTPSADATTVGVTTSPSEDLVGEEEAPEVSKEQLVEAFTSLIEKNVAAAKAVLGKFKLVKLGGAQPEQFAEIYAKVQEALNG